MRSNRVRHLLVAMLAVFAISAVAAASASAAHPYEVCQEKGTEEFTEHLCKTKAAGGKWSFAPLEAGQSFEVEGTSGTSTLVGKELITIECTADTFKGAIEAKGLSTGEVKFTGCTPIGPKKEALPKCKVTEPIAFKFEDKTTVFGSPPAVGDLFEPASGLTFVTIEVTGEECLLKGKYEVKGKQQCELPKGEEGLVTHEIVCLPAGSELKLKTAVAEFTSTEKVKLVNGWAWRVKA
jgi:hypothetical protein